MTKRNEKARWAILTKELIFRHPVFLT